MDARTKEIVVGIDGSPRSVHALRRGYRIAEAMRCRLVALTAWHYPVTFGAYVVNGWQPEADARAAQLSAIAEVFGPEPPDWFSAEFVEDMAAPALVRRSRSAEMVIVGSRGRGGFAGLLLGSVSRNVAAHAQCPVLVVHDARDEVTFGPTAAGSDPQDSVS